MDEFISKPVRMDLMLKLINREFEKKVPHAEPNNYHA